jgi:hypothetical protein
MTIFVVFVQVAGIEIMDLIVNIASTGSKGEVVEC